jgi:hypothetical protein
MLGDPSGASQFWGRQHGDDCTLMAVADVVGELTGTKPTESDILALAAGLPNVRHSGPIYTAAKAGATKASRRNQLPGLPDLPVLLAHYGLQTVATDDTVAARGGPPTGMPGLEAALRAGKKVIVSLNGETIWGQAGDHTLYDHAVVVTGTDSAAGIVHLNDSAIPSLGPDSQISATLFEAAWATSNHAMLLIERAAPAASDSRPS